MKVCVIITAVKRSIGKGRAGWLVSYSPPPVPHDNCVRDPISRLLTMGTMPV